MLTRHQNELLNRLEDVVELGSSHIRHSELLNYYGADRFTTGIWRDLQEKWREMLLAWKYKEDKLSLYPLWIAYIEEINSYLLVWGANLKLVDDSPECKDTFLYPLERWIEWADRAKTKRKSKVA